MRSDIKMCPNWLKFDNTRKDSYLMMTLGLIFITPIVAQRIHSDRPPPGLPERRKFSPSWLGCAHWAVLALMEKIYKKSPVHSLNTCYMSLRCTWGHSIIVFQVPNPISINQIPIFQKENLNKEFWRKKKMPAAAVASLDPWLGSTNEKLAFNF